MAIDLYYVRLCMFEYIGTYAIFRYLRYILKHIRLCYVGFVYMIWFNMTLYDIRYMVILCNKMIVICTTQYCLSMSQFCIKMPEYKLWYIAALLGKYHLEG